MPIFSEFPPDEYETRCKKIKILMEEYDIDILLLTQKENVEYFSGFLTSLWVQKDFAPGVVLLPREGEPILLVPSFLRGTAERASWVKNIRDIVGYPPYKKYVELIVKTIKDLGFAESNIGVESGWGCLIGMPLVDFEAIKSYLSRARFVNNTDVVQKVRAIKSPREVKLLKKASLITCKAFKKCFESLKVGMSERQIAKILSIFMLEKGADRLGFINLKSGPEKYPMADTLPTDRKIRKGDLIILDAGAVYRGYFSDMVRVAFIGEPSEKQKEMYKIVLRANNAGIESVKTGIKASDVHTSIMNVIKASRYANKAPISTQIVGHGVGLDMHEAPILGPGVKTLLEPGMVIAVETWLHDPFNLGVFGVEDDILVTEEGYEVLTPMEREELWVV